MSDAFEAQDAMFGGPSNSMYECNQSDNLIFLRGEVKQLEAENKKLKELLIRYNENTDYYSSELAGSWIEILNDAIEALK